MFNWIIKRLLFGIQNILFIQSITWIKIRIIETTYFPPFFYSIYTINIYYNIDYNILK